MLVRGRDFVRLTTRCTTKTLVAAPRGRRRGCASIEETQTGGLLCFRTRQFAHWCPWVGGGCVGKCERWKAGTRRESLLQSNATLPQCRSLPGPITKSAQNPTLYSLIHPSDPGALFSLLGPEFNFSFQLSYKSKFTLVVGHRERVCIRNVLLS